MGSKVNTMNSYATMYKIVAGSFGFFTVTNFYNGSEKFYDQFLMPVINYFGPENAQRWTLFANKYRLLPKSHYQDPRILYSTKFGLNVTNPIGITATFDKHGDSIRGLFDVGFGFVEIEPEYEDLSSTDNEAMKSLDVMNLLSNSSNIVRRIEKVRQDPKFKGVIGVNLGSKNYSKNVLKDFSEDVETYGPVAHYLVVNYNCIKNHKLKLETLISKLKSTCDKLQLNNRPLLLLKLSPNPTVAERKKIASVINQNQYNINGIIIPTAVENERLLQLLPDEDPKKTEARKQVVDCIQDMYQLTKGKIIIIGDGGVSTGEEAYENIKAGASFLQIYFPLLLHGPPRVTRIKRDLEKLLKLDGYTNINEAVGIDTRQQAKHYFFPFY